MEAPTRSIPGTNPTPEAIKDVPIPAVIGKTVAPANSFTSLHD
jgi:hypothetical protein